MLALIPKPLEGMEPRSLTGAGDAAGHLRGAGSWGEGGETRGREVGR